MSPPNTSKTLASLMKFFAHIAEEKFFEEMCSEIHKSSDGISYLKTSTRILKAHGFNKRESFIYIGILNSFSESPLKFESIKLLADDIWDETKDKKEARYVSPTYNPIYEVGPWGFNDFTGILSYNKRCFIRLPNGKRSHRFVKHMFENGIKPKLSKELFEELLDEERDECEKTGEAFKPSASLRDYALRKDSSIGRILNKLFSASTGTDAEISFNINWVPSEEDYDKSLDPN